MAGIIERYRNRLPVGPGTPVITLDEGGTPLVHAPRLARRLGLSADCLLLKIEGANPTGSFKDRGMTLAISKAMEDKAEAVICASTGNTAASAAAYAARAGLPCYVLLPRGAVAKGKLSQAIIHGALVFQVAGNFDICLELVRTVAARRSLTIVNSTNLYRLEGQKTAAFEIVEQLGRFPDYQFMPVGNAGNITAYWKGYQEMASSKFSPQPSALSPQPLPRMMGFQALGAAPLVLGRPVKNPKTIATAIRIGNPVSWSGAIAARDESGGIIDSVTDKEIMEAYRFLAQKEGVFCEPSGAAGVAGLIKCANRRKFQLSLRGRDTRIVAILTGHGLKDPEAPALGPSTIHSIDPTLSAIERVLKA